MRCPTFLPLILTNIRVADGTLLLTIIVAVVNIDGGDLGLYYNKSKSNLLRNVGMTGPKTRVQCSDKGKDEGMKHKVQYKE